MTCLPCRRQGIGQEARDHCLTCSAPPASRRALSADRSRASRTRIGTAFFGGCQRALFRSRRRGGAPRWLAGRGSRNQLQATGDWWDRSQRPSCPEARRGWSPPLRALIWQTSCGRRRAFMRIVLRLEFGDRPQGAASPASDSCSGSGRSRNVSSPKATRNCSVVTKV